MEDSMHKKVSFRVVQKWAAVRKAVRRANWAHAQQRWDGFDFDWVQAAWEVVERARARVR